MDNNGFDSDFEPGTEALIEENQGDGDNIIPRNDDDEVGVVGEYDQDSTEDIELVSPSSYSNCISEFPLSKELKELAEKRIKTLIQLDRLEAKRIEFKESGELDANITVELNKQSNEYRMLPEKEALKNRFEIFQQKIKDAKEAQKKAKEAAVIEGKQNAEIVISPKMQTVWQFASEQYKKLFERSEQSSEIFAATEKYLKSEPLYNMLIASGYTAEKLFSLSVYCLALESWAQTLKQLKKSEQQSIKKTSTQKTGIFKRMSKDMQESIAKSEDISNYCTSTISIITKEIKGLEKTMVEEFWKCYEFCSCLLVGKKLDKKREPIIRVFIRYGLLGHAPWFISPMISKTLIKNCIEDVKRELPPSQKTDKILYADEYLEHTVANTITGSIDEDLELTGRNTPEWQADKAARRISYSKNRAFVLKEIRSELIDKIRALRALQQEEEIRASKMIKTAQNYKKQRSVLAQSIQKCKVESARYERIIHKIDNVEIPGLKDKAQNAKEKLDSSGVKRGVFTIARKEAAAIHRVCRLCARLKDPFIPFILRDSYSVRPEILNSRAEMKKILDHIEYADKHIFHEVLVASKKESSRIDIRVAPVVLITPSCGFMGYSWNPRGGVEAGKMVVPGYCPRANIKERMVYNMISDFRWDTSKAEAGIDLLTSDTLVAAYSACRWNYRKKKKENREKALIFNEQNDRANWRRHYELFFMSANDSGRKLYYKNYEVYEMVMKYIGLPEGMERLRR